MKKLYISILVIIIAVAGFFAYNKYYPKPVTDPIVVASPLNTSYTIDGRVYDLINGKAEIEASPGSALKNTATIFGEPAIGDLNNDGVQDAGVLISLDTGGSGTFYYLVATLVRNGVYTSTNAIFLGDRIAPQNISIENGKLITNYADRGPTDPMTVKPYIGVTKRAYVESGKLKELAVLKGRIVWGGEVRTFQLCSNVGENQGDIESQWIEGKSPALALIKSTYEKEMAGSGPYSPMYAEIIGSEVPIPQDGFGADYKKAVSVDQLTVGSAFGSCKQDLIVLENIKPGDYLDTKVPLRLKGKARGNWYFEASFPVQVLDRHANVLASGFVSAQGDWMTTNFVPFAGALTFTKAPAANSFGKIVLKKDNPSDDRALDDALEVLVYFK